jgi:hypothetical protein
MSKAEIDALRFEIIKRLAPGFRHQLSGKLHPVTLLSQLMTKKLEKNPTDMDFVLNKMQELNLFAKQANTSLSDFFLWLNPTDTLLLPLNKVVADCLDLLKMDIHTSNVTFQNELTSTQLVNAPPVRAVFSAGILTLIDTTATATHISIEDQTQGLNRGIVMTITPQISSAKKEIVATSFDNWSKVSQLSDTVTCERTSNQIIFSVKH